MKFLRLHDPGLGVLFENDDIVAIDKPYGIDTHTNDSKVGNEEFIQHGLIELFSRQLGFELHIVHRLDRTTTGAIVFAKNLAAAKTYQDFFRNRETKKTYLFVTDQSSTQSNYSCDKTILHKGSELTAKTDFERLQVNSGFELWQAKPHTGRNHQIRIHAQELGLSILGDRKYGTSNYPFLCLHNRRIEFPNGVTIESQAPRYFDELSFLKNRPLAEAFFQIDRRQRLFPNESCIRLVHFNADSETTLDRFGEYLLLNSDREQKLYELLAHELDEKLHVRQSQGDTSWTVEEDGSRYEIRPDSGVGLALDQRALREWVRENSENKSVLSLFSHTCTYAIAAARGGARDVTSVDTSKRALEWGRKNFELNSLDSTGAKFLCRDAMAYLAKCQVKYDLVICEPPAFSRGEKGLFKIEEQIEPLIQACWGVLEPGGAILFSTAFDKLGVDAIRRIIERQVQDPKGPRVEVSYLESGLDFELPGERPVLKSFLCRLN